jgi:hypothetical protein
MIGALLGAVSPPHGRPENLPHHIPPSQRASRIVNLLQAATENRALAEYRDEYEEDFRRAVYPELFNVSGGSSGPADSSSQVSE